MMLPALLLLISLQPMSPVIEDRCDLMEVNHFYDDTGKLTFMQLVFWDWDNHGAFHVSAWRMMKTESHTPVRNGKGWKVAFHENGVMREIVATNFRETYSQFDPELEDRDLWPKEDRRELGTKP